jgi:hypothetical protein
MTKAQTKLQRRISIYATFTGIDREIITKALEYANYIRKMDIRIGCDCGCGGDSLFKSELELLDIAWRIKHDLFTSKN